LRLPQQFWREATESTKKSSLKVSKAKPDAVGMRYGESSQTSINIITFHMKKTLEDNQVLEGSQKTEMETKNICTKKAM
jgi:hypothetical protein